MTDGNSGIASPRLVGWKRIAAHLRCGERTARRWEAQEGLPVYRHVHETKSTVFALPGELDAWLAERAADGPALGVTEVAAEESAPLAMPSRPGANRLTVLVAGMLVVALGVIIALRYVPERQPRPTPGVVLSADPVANGLYHRGRAMWEQRGVEASERAIKMLSAAVERDEEFAAAWSTLAMAWATYSTYVIEADHGRALDEAIVAASRALELDPSLAEARSLMAFFAQRKGDWAESQRIYEQALALDSDNANLILWYSSHFRELGMFERARELTAQARELMPTSPAVLTEIAMNHLQAYETQRGAELLDVIREDLGIETPILWFGTGMVGRRRGDPQSLSAWAQRSPFPGTATLLMEFITVELDDGDAVDALATNIEAAYQDGRLPGFGAVHLLIELDRPERALSVAEREAEDGEFINSAVLYDLQKPALRLSDRFTAVADRLGMIAYWKEVGAPDFCRSQPDTPVCLVIAGDGRP
ncbi:MAG: tetratricopeptide repeat protein [Pseudomonadota bacterium]